MHDPDELDMETMVSILRQVQDALWPNGCRDHEWSPDTVNQVADALIQGGIGLDYSKME